MEWPWGWGGGYVCAQQHGAPTHQGRSRRCLCWSSNDTLNSGSPIVLNFENSHLGASWQYWTPCAPKGAVIRLDWNPHVFQAQVCLSHTQGLSELRNTSLTEHSIHWHRILHSIALDIETHFTAKELQWAHDRGTHRFCHSHTPRNASPTEWWSGG